MEKTSNDSIAPAPFKMDEILTAKEIKKVLLSNLSLLESENVRKEVESFASKISLEIECKSEPLKQRIKYLTCRSSRLNERNKKVKEKLESDYLYKKMMEKHESLRRAVMKVQMQDISIEKKDKEISRLKTLIKDLKLELEKNNLCLPGHQNITKYRKL